MSAAIAAAISAVAKVVGGVSRGNERTNAQAANAGVREVNSTYKAEHALQAGATNAMNAQINHSVAMSQLEIGASKEQANLSVESAATGTTGGTEQQKQNQIQMTKEYNQGQEGISFEQELDRIKSTTTNSVVSAVTSMSNEDFEGMNAGMWGALAGGATYLSLQ